MRPRSRNRLRKPKKKKRAWFKNRQKDSVLEGYIRAMIEQMAQDEEEARRGLYGEWINPAPPMHFQARSIVEAVAETDPPQPEPVYTPTFTPIEYFPPLNIRMTDGEV